MILKEQNNREIIIGGLSKQSYGIDDNVIMFDILRNKLYSNPIGAVAREISSNSRDANREAGSSNNIEILFTNDNFLSSIGDTSIVFKDSGIGISPERMSTVFLNYGSSTKRDCNLQTGAFGIGNKTPFCTTDSYVIKTVNEGIEYVYNAIIGASGKGDMILLSEESTTSPSGTEIIIPILSNQDRLQFEQEVYKYTMHWGCVTYTNFKTPKPNITYTLEDEAFRITPFKDAHFVGMLDGIPYEIKPTGVTGISGYTVLLNIDLDKVTINANRESLQYDESTKKHVDEKIASFKERLQEIISEYLSDNNTFLEAYQKFKRISNKEATDFEALLYSLKKDVFHGYEFKTFFNGQEVTKINLQHHQLCHVKRGTNGFKYNQTGFTLEYPVVYLDKGGIKIPKNEKLGEFLLIKPDKSIAKDIYEKEKEYLEGLGINIINYSDVKPPKSEKVRMYLRGDNFHHDKFLYSFDKTNKCITQLLPSEAVFKVVDNFTNSYYSYSSRVIDADKHTIFKHETKIQKIFYVSETNWRRYLEPAGYKKYEDELAKINFQKYSKYVEAGNIRNTISKFPDIIVNNFPELLPKSFHTLRNNIAVNVPKGLESVRFSNVVKVTDNKFDYDGVVKKFKERLKQNFPLLPYYISNSRDEENIKIKNIKNYINK